MLERKLDEARTKKSYNKVAWVYNFWSQLTESRAAKLVIELAGISDHQKILEIPCGTGIVFEEILKRNGHGSSIGIDLSEKMLDKARKRVKHYPKHQYELREGNIMSLDYKDNSFDILISNYVVPAR